MKFIDYAIYTFIMLTLGCVLVGNIYSFIAGNN